MSAPLRRGLGRLERLIALSLLSLLSLSLALSPSLSLARANVQARSRLTALTLRCRHHDPLYATRYHRDGDYVDTDGGMADWEAMLERKRESVRRKQEREGKRRLSMSAQRIGLNFFAESSAKDMFGGSYVPEEERIAQGEEVKRRLQRQDAEIETRRRLRRASLKHTLKAGVLSNLAMRHMQLDARATAAKADTAVTEAASVALKDAGGVGGVNGAAIAIRAANAASAGGEAKGGAASGGALAGGGTVSDGAAVGEGDAAAARHAHHHHRRHAATGKPSGSHHHHRSADVHSEEAIAIAAARCARARNCALPLCDCIARLRAITPVSALTPHSLPFPSDFLLSRRTGALRRRG